MGYKSINEAINAVRSGGTIYVRAGTYAEKGQSTTCYLINKPLSLLAYGGENVILTYPTGSPPLIAGELGYIINTLSPVILDQLTIVGTRDEGNNATQDTDINILVGAGATIRRCTFQKWGHSAIKMATTSDPVIIEQNIFELGGFDGRDHHIYSSNGANSGRNIIRHNIFKSASGYAVHLYDRTPINHDIYGNVMFSCGAGGILLGGTGHKIYNNTIYNCGGYAGLVFWKNESTGNEVKNNIIRLNTSNDITLDDAGVEAAAYNNKHSILITGGSYNTSTDIDTDPIFVSGTPATWLDFRLSVGSPMINNGELLPSPYNQVLDPNITTVPTPKVITSSVIGAFTNE